MNRKSYRANNPLQVLNKVTDKQWVDTSHGGTPRDAQPGRCYKGDGSAEFFSAANLTDELTKGFTMSCWFSSSGIPEAASGIMTYGSWIAGYNSFSVVQVPNSGNLEFWYTSIDGTNSKYVWGVPSIDVWYHILIQWDLAGSGTLKGFIDNVEVFSFSAIGSTLDSESFGFGGVLVGNLGRKFQKARIFDCRIWDRVLDLTEIERVNLHSGTGDEHVWLKCDEGSGTIAYDSSGNGHHGTIKNTSSDFHTIQDEYSWQNTVGYSGDNGFITLFDDVFSDGLASGWEGTGADLEITPEGLLKVTNTVNNGFAKGRINNPSHPNILVAPTLGNCKVTAKYRGGTSEGELRINTTKSQKLVNDGDIGGVEFTITSSHHVALLNLSVKVGDYSLWEFTRIERLYTEFIPKDESIKLPPFKDVTGGVLDYIGHCQNNVDWVDSACFQGVSGRSSYIDAPALDLSNKALTLFETYVEIGTIAAPQPGICAVSLTDSTRDGRFNIRQQDDVLSIEITYLNDIGNAVIVLAEDISIGDIYHVKLERISGTIYNVIVNGDIKGTRSLTRLPITDTGFRIGNYAPARTNYWIGKIYGVKFEFTTSSDNRYYTLAEPIQNPSSHTYFDISGNGNHATLVNGSLANYGRQDEFHPLMKDGFSNGIIFTHQSDDPFVTNEVVNINSDIIDVSFYVLNDFVDTFQGLFGNTNPGGTPDTGGFSVEWKSNQLRIWVYSAGGANQIRFPATQKGLYRVLIDPTLTNIVRVWHNGVELTATVSIDTGERNFSLANLAWEIGTRKGSIFYFQNGIAYFQAQGLFWVKFGDTPKDLLDNYTFSSTRGDIFYIPKHATNNTDALGNPLTHPQDGTRMLPCGTLGIQKRTPALVQADKGKNIFFYSDGTPKKFSQGFLALNQFNNDQLFVGNEHFDDGYITPVAFHKASLERAQLDTEKVIRDAEELGSESGDVFYFDFERDFSSIAVSGASNPVWRVEGRIISSSSTGGQEHTGTGGGRLTVDDLSAIAGISLNRLSGIIDLSEFTGITNQFRLNELDAEEVIMPDGNISVSTEFVFNSCDKVKYLDLRRVSFNAPSTQIRFNDLLRTVHFPTTPQPSVTSLLVNNNRVLTGVIDVSGFINANINFSGCDLTGIVLPTTSAAISLNLSFNVKIEGELDLSSIPNLTGSLQIERLKITEIIFPASTNTISSLNMKSVDKIVTLDMSNLTSCTSYRLVGMSALDNITFPTSSAAVRNIFLINSFGIQGVFDVSGLSDFGGVLYVQGAGITSFLLPSSTSTFTSLTVNCQNAVWNADLTNIPINGGMSLYLDSVTGFTFNAANKSCQNSLTLRGYSLNNNALDLSELSDLGGTVNLGNSTWGSITFPSSHSTQIVNLLVANCDNITNLDITGLTDLTNQINISGCDVLTNITLPTNSTNTLRLFTAFNSDLGYIDFKVMPNAMNLSNAAFRLENNSMTAEEVNHILVDLDANTTSGFTGRTLNIAGTNAAPDTTSGGYNGVAAVTSLEAKGITVTHS